MRVRMERSGGFANIQESVSTDTAELPAEAAEQVLRLTEGLDLNRQPAPDAYQYHVMIERDDGSVDTGVASDSEAAAALFSTLQTYS
jgi:hypothetical protein